MCCFKCSTHWKKIHMGMVPHVCERVLHSNGGLVVASALGPLKPAGDTTEFSFRAGASLGEYFVNTFSTKLYLVVYSFHVL